MNDKLYVHYGKDGLPDAVADNRAQLARMLGIKTKTVSESISHKSKRFALVETEDVEDRVNEVIGILEDLKIIASENYNKSHKNIYSLGFYKGQKTAYEDVIKMLKTALREDEKCLQTI